MQLDAVIMKVLGNDDRVCDTTSDLLETAASFYEMLYRSEPTSPHHEDELAANIIRRLSDEHMRTLDGSLTAEETREAVLPLRPNKSPGVDGIPIEVYRRFWVLLEDGCLAVYREALDSGRLGLIQQTGIVRLLYKKGDRRDLRNWRPISLHADYRL